jgi:enoyl-CoA hydratase/carnithine racemase
VVAVVSVRRHNGVVHIEPVRPTVDAETVAHLSQLVGDLADDPSVRAAVFHLGRGRHGPGPAGRLDPGIGRLAPGDGLSVLTRLEKVIAALERLPCPTVAVLEGPIGSVGLELALVADLTIASPDTVFYVSGPERGFLPGMSLYRLLRYVGPGLARQIVLHRTTLRAAEAHRLGIVDRIVPVPAQALGAELSRLLSLPPAALNLARQLLTEGGPMDYAQAYDSYKAAQFHALHRLAGAASPDPAGEAPLSAAEYVTAPVDRWTDPDLVPVGARRDADPDAAAVLHRLDGAGIAGALLYPANVLWAYGRCPGGPLTALLRGYNDWVLELCAGEPDRLRPAVLLDVDDPAAAAAEVRRTAAAGAAAAVIPLFPHNEQRYDSPRYEPLWSALEECGVPITLHRGSCRHIGADARPFDLALHRVDGEDELFDQVFDALESSYARLAVVAMVLSGVFAQHPGLNVVIVDFGLAWAPYTLLRLDEQYEVRPERAGAEVRADQLGGDLATHALPAEHAGFVFADGERPSDHFRRHVFVAVDDDPLGLELTDILGPRNILWAGQLALPPDPLPGPLPDSLPDSLPGPLPDSLPDSLPDPLPGPGAVRRMVTLTNEERITVERRNAISLYGFPADGAVR